MIDIRHSENLAGMSELLVTHRGAFTLAYLDPPFRTGKRQIGPAGSYEDPAVEMGEFVSGLMRRAIKAWELLNDHGCLVVHIDPKTSHYVKVELDKCLGARHFASEIIWRYRRWPSKTRNFQRVHDVLLRYVKSPDDVTWNQLYEPLAPSTLKTWGTGKQLAIVENGRRNRSSATDEPTRGTPMGDVWDIGIVAPVAKERLFGCRCKRKDRQWQGLTEQGESHRRDMSKLVSTERKGSLTSLSGNDITDPLPQGCRSIIETETSKTTRSETLNSSTQLLTRESTPVANYETEHGGSHVVFAESSSPSSENIGTSPKERSARTFLGAGHVTSRRQSSANGSVLRLCRNCGKHIGFYPTQKPEALLERLILACTNTGDLVLDPYLGSGTTPAVCARLGRGCVAFDENIDAVTVTRNRLEGANI